MGEVVAIEESIIGSLHRFAEKAATTDQFIAHINSATRFDKVLREEIVANITGLGEVNGEPLAKITNLLKLGRVEEALEMANVNKALLKKETIALLNEESKLFPHLDILQRDNLIIQLKKTLGDTAVATDTATSVLKEIRTDPTGKVAQIMNRLLKMRLKLLLAGVALPTTIVGLVNYIKRVQSVYRGCVVFYRTWYNGEVDLKICKITAQSCPSHPYDPEYNRVPPDECSNDIRGLNPSLIPIGKCIGENPCMDTCKSSENGKGFIIRCNDQTFWETVSLLCGNQVENFTKFIGTIQSTGQQIVNNSLFSVNNFILGIGKYLNIFFVVLVAILSLWLAKKTIFGRYNEKQQI